MDRQNADSSPSPNVSSSCSYAIPEMPPSLELSLKIIGVCNIVAALPTLAMNLCVLVAIARTNTLRTKTNAILCCILIINILQGCVSLPLFGVLIIRIANNETDCLARDAARFLGSSFAIISMISVDLLTYERYTAISDPFNYEERFTSKRIKAAVASIWIVSFSMMSTLIINGAKLAGIVFATMVTVTTYAFNVIAHIIIHRTVVRLRSQQIQPNVSDSNAEAALEQQRKERRTIKFSVYIIIFLLACYMPSVFSNIFNGLNIQATIFMAVATTFLMLHATFSPVLYIWQSPQIGRAVKCLVRCGASVQISSAQ